MEPLISLKGISIGFDKSVILDNLDLDIYPGEIIGLIGRSGCGKSTLIKILVGYYIPDKGSIIFNGKDITKKFNKVKELVGYTTQENSFYEKLTIHENMSYYANLYNVIKSERKSRIRELLRSINLFSSKDKLAEDISGGMKRRLDFAISLLHKPKLIILDEPTTGLDPILVENFWNIVTDIVKKEKIAVLVSSHLLSEIKTHCTKAAIMSDKKLKVLNITKSLDLEDKFKELT